ncbi:MAG: UDP-glucose 4-epimerase GalE [Bacteroidales bacterium]|nr:UDP-glucose 4-epimerase GalE [Bacteroidales bacterium]MBP5724236.1 UDP-glucose 4-epimerase GalE [Bacteroidales bacterium]
MAKILVTGGLGYIGSHTVVELIQSGYEVVIVDNLSNSEVNVLDGIESITGVRPAFEQIDICDSSLLQNCFKKYGVIDAVIHFAAYKAVGESIEKSLDYYYNNVYGLLQLLSSMRANGVKHLIFSSSCTVYGQPDKLPIDETAPRKPATSPYGNTKQMCEDIIRDAIVSYHDFTAILLRYFNPIGAHPSAKIGELPKGVPNNLVPFVTQTAAGIRKELSVFGDDYNTPDGSAIRDYIYVVDLAKAHVKAMQRLLAGSNKSELEIFNLGTGKGVSVLELVHSFMAATGVKVPYKIVGRRAGDTEEVWADSSLAEKELGWTARTPLNEVLLSAWNWEKKVRGIKE